LSIGHPLKPCSQLRLILILILLNDNPLNVTSAVNSEKNPYINGTGILSHELAKQLLEHPNVPVFYNSNDPIIHIGTITMARVDSIIYSAFKEPVGTLKLEPACITILPFKQAQS
jgi:hypothetical protein